MTTDRVYNVLFLRTGNSARSILAESILNTEGKGRFKAYSAGSQPKGEVNPLALKELEALDYQSTGFRSKSRALRRWISSSRSATAPQAKPARCGLAIR